MNERRTKVITFSMEPDVIEMIEIARGRKNRSKYLNDLLKEVLTDHPDESVVKSEE